jgi:hypothetical protein
MIGESGLSSDYLYWLGKGREAQYFPIGPPLLPSFLFVFLLCVYTIQLGGNVE